MPLWNEFKSNDATPKDRRLLLMTQPQMFDVDLAIASRPGRLEAMPALTRRRYHGRDRRRGLDPGYRRVSCCADSVDDVARKCEELGLNAKRK
jgi:hypothetical protein